MDQRDEALLRRLAEVDEQPIVDALDTGCTVDEVVAVLAPVISAARVSGAAVNDATAIGCHVDVAGQIDRALEEADDPDDADRTANERGV